MAKVIMVQGTMSNVGKSVIAAGLCRIFKQDGFKVAPFKSQNMALNSYVTSEGLEMGRAQVMQAEAAGLRPLVCMNPILLKPTDDTGSQVIVNGVPIGNMSAKDYFAYKRKLVPEIKKAFFKLARDNDIIVIEGAGSPAEINLKENDIVNMGIARMFNAPVVLAGDIDRGGVFAQLLGTMELLSDDERASVKGLIINKFRGDKSLLDSGIEMLEERVNVKVAGVLPFMRLKLDDEDSLSERFDVNKRGAVDIAVIRLPRISNFTDFNIFEQSELISVRYITSPGEISGADALIIPGSKNTIADLEWMKSNGFFGAVKAFAETKPVFGICGGFQMLGMSISDPYHTEAGGTTKALGLLPVETVMLEKKTRMQASGQLNEIGGVFSGMSDTGYSGYEIHTGETRMDGGIVGVSSSDKVVVSDGKNVCGTYIHGIFDSTDIAETFVRSISKSERLPDGPGLFMDNNAFKEEQYDKLADIMREHLDMEFIYGILEEASL